MMLAARKARSQVVTDEPVFKTPLRGMGSLIATLEQRVTSLGVNIVKNCHVNDIQPIPQAGTSRTTYNVITSDGVYDADAMVVSTPAKTSARFMASIHPHVASQLAQWNHADVILVTMAIPRSQWRRDLTGSGYLVPKPDQRWITAASFGSNKWSHWKNDNDDMILRISLGRDGVEVMHLHDDEVVNLTLADLKMHLGEDFSPSAIRITRWPDAFPQYRPHHFDTLANVERLLIEHGPGICLAGASYRGIGIPACIQQARTAAETTVAYLSNLAN
jgi:oxygen-dependent protoporphyrinogen oxidase